MEALKTHAALAADYPRAQSLFLSVIVFENPESPEIAVRADQKIDLYSWVPE